MRKSAIGMLVLVVLTLAGRGTAQDSGSTLKGADAAYADRNYETARSLYERAIREGASLDSDLPRARNLATAYLNANPAETAKSIQWLQTVVRLDPQADGMRLQLCKLLLSTGDTGGAVQQYRQLVDKHPQTSDYVLALAAALRQDGKSDAALHLLKETVDRYPNLNVVRVEYARSLNFVRDFSEARRQFAKVLDNDPNDLIAQVGMAKSMSYDGDQEGALVEYDTILRKHPGLYDAMIGKAFALLWSGHTDEARELLQRGLARHPDDREVRDALSSLPRSNGSSQSVPAPAPVVAPPIAVPQNQVVSVSAPTVQIHQSPAASITEPPRTLTPPRSEKSRTNAAKGGKAGIVPDNKAAPPVGEPAPETPVALPGPPVEFLYAIFAIAIALLIFAGVKLRSMQQARTFEVDPAETAMRDGYGAEATTAAIMDAEHARRLSDIFAPMTKEEVVVNVADHARIEDPYEIELAEIPEVPEAFDEMFVVPAPASAEKILEGNPFVVVPPPQIAPVPVVVERNAVYAEQFAAPEVKPVELDVTIEAKAEEPSTTATRAPIKIESIAALKPELIMPTSDALPVEARGTTIEPLPLSRDSVEAVEVLIVGGLASVVQLQRRWLSTQIPEIKILLERDWATATMRLSTNPPAIIILNSSSDDRWTSMRMFAWITSSYPELRQRVIAVTTADNCPVNTDDLVICEPIDAQEWQRKVSAALAANDELDVASIHDASRYSARSGRISLQ